MFVRFVGSFNGCFLSIYRFRFRYWDVEVNRRDGGFALWY